MGLSDITHALKLDLDDLATAVVDLLQLAHYVVKRASTELVAWPELSSEIITACGDWWRARPHSDSVLVEQAKDHVWGAAQCLLLDEHARIQALMKGELR